jgi:hypothetical protein
VLIETIRVEVEPEDGDDLLEALSVRGLASRLLRDEEERVEVEVSPPPENWEMWNLEVVSALEAWLEERERESVVARTGRHSYVVRAPRPLPERTAVPGPPPVAPPPVALPDVDDTARMPALAPVPEAAVPRGVLEEPQLHLGRPRPIVLAAAGATVVLALAGLLLLAVLVASLL